MEYVQKHRSTRPLFYFQQLYNRLELKDDYKTVIKGIIDDTPSFVNSLIERWASIRDQPFNDSHIQLFMAECSIYKMPIICQQDVSTFAELIELLSSMNPLWLFDLHAVLNSPAYPNVQVSILYDYRLTSDEIDKAYEWFKSLIED